MTPDGLEVEIMRLCMYGNPGDRKMLSYSTAKQLIALGIARSASAVVYECSTLPDESSVYLSIVMGGAVERPDLLERLNNSMSNTLRLAEKYKLNMELVLVEWLTRDDSPLVIDTATWPVSNIPVRIIHVPPSVQKSIPNPHGMKYLEYHAKNVGIRRSRGRFVLSSNIDVMLSEELVSLLAQEQLSDGNFYRADLHYMDRAGKVFEVHHCGEPLIPSPIYYYASGDFTMMSRADWFKIHGCPEEPYNNSVDGQTLYLATLHGLKQVIFSQPTYHQYHDRNAAHYYSPAWDDFHPHAVKNGDGWGQAALCFQETTVLHGRGQQLSTVSFPLVKL